MMRLFNISQIFFTSFACTGGKMNKGVLFLILIVVGFLVAVAQFGFTVATGYTAIVFFVIAVIFLNLEKIAMARIFFMLCFFSVLVWLAAFGMPPSQVIALAGWALLILAITRWEKNKVQTVTLAVLAIGILIFSQYVRVVILGQ